MNSGGRSNPTKRDDKDTPEKVTRLDEEIA